MASENQNRPPRGALIVIAIGLFATVVAALLSTDKPLGATTLEWVEEARMPDPKPVEVPGGGRMTLSEGQIRSTEPNAGEYTLFRSSGLLTIDAGSAIGQGRLTCAISVPKRTIVAKTPNSRASYPRSSEDLAEQEIHETSLVEFNSHSAELASVEIDDVISSRYTREPGIVVEWAPYRIGRQAWQLGFPSGRPKEALSLPFVSIWRTTVTPAARISCTIETAVGSATVHTAGSLD
ncbi:MAG TPA: hypothetical protein VFW48_03685 [Solirubrobacterales bacterium]|nr:hypothetical protein [Solirubrobacterales bacterium]